MIFANVSQNIVKWWSHDGHLTTFHIMAEAQVQIAAAVGAVVGALFGHFADQEGEIVSNNE